MDIKLIALDLDGTLLNNNGELSKRNCDAIKKAINSGVQIVIATGRNIGLICKEIKSISGIRYVISSNGAAVIDLEKDKIIYSNFIGLDIIKKIIALIKNYPIVIEFYADGHTYVNKDIFINPKKYNINEKHIKLMSYNHILIENIFEVICQDPNICWINSIEKVNIPFLNDDIKREIINSLYNKFDEIKITSSVKDNIEINIFNANKGNALKKLVDILRIKMEYVVAIGDNNNDFEMIEKAGIGIAMENAICKLKNKADYITASNDNDGVAEAILKILNNDIKSMSSYSVD